MRLGIKGNLEILILSVTIVISHNYFDTAVLANGKPNQVNSVLQIAH